MRRGGWLRGLGPTLASMVGTGLVAGAVLGLCWWQLAPVAKANVVDGGVYLSGHTELAVAQDGWLAVVLGLAGVIAATVQAVRSREPQATRALLAIVGVALAGLVAWRVGQWLGPSSLRVQVKGGSTHPTTPLELRTVSVLLIGPLLFAVTRCLAALFSSPHQRGAAQAIIVSPDASTGSSART